MLPDLAVEDRVQLRKGHPCGGYEWKVIRIGADIRIECLTCGRSIMVPRRKLARRIKQILPREETPDDLP